MRFTSRMVCYACLAVLPVVFPHCAQKMSRRDRAWKRPLKERQFLQNDLYDRFGGWKEIQSRASGFFRVEEIDGIWWMITPEGNVFLSKGVNAFWCARGREKETISWLRSIGVNSLGAWSTTDRDRGVATGRMPYAKLLNFLKSYASIKGEVGKKRPDVFSKRFAESVRKQAEAKVKPLASDAYLIGWWTDNELMWASENPPLLDAYLALPREAPGRRVAEDFLIQTFGSPSMPKNESRLQLARDGFLEMAVRHYAEITTKGIREYDKNHLILGCRVFISPIPWKNIMPERMGGFEAIARGARGYWDILSVNAYFDNTPKDRLRSLYESFQGPILMSEFNIWSADRDHGKRGEQEWMARVQITVEGCKEQIPVLLAEPYTVGYHYFPFFNYESPQDDSSRPGLVNFKGEEREILIETLRSINMKLEEIHRSGVDKL